MLADYLTIKEKVTAEYEIQRSRFIAVAAPVKTEEAAVEFVREQKKEYYDARHNPSAWVLGERGDRQRSNDDGEPGGTAGSPILEAIKKRNLTEVAIVVTRYFGGIKLGAGGLTRAYGYAAALALEAATLICMAVRQEVSLTIPYGQLAIVENYLRGQGIDSKDAAYAEQVTLHLLLPPGETQLHLKTITDLTAARCVYSLGKLQQVPISR
ncbi:MAG: YigZ family protein [Selenomonadaceae bacterium]|nr:YigZ family protein [Selenomonadaceae bacterium]